MTAALCSRLGNEILDIAQKLLVERHHSTRIMPALLVLDNLQLGLVAINRSTCRSQDAAPIRSSPRGGALARATSIGPRAATGISADAAGGIPRYGVTRRGGNNDRLSTLWREVISLAGVARSFSKASSYRSVQCRHRDDAKLRRSQEARYAKQRRKRSRSKW